MAKTAKTTAIRTGEASPPLLFRHVSPGPGDSTLQFRLLHFWEARKNVKGGPGILLGIEMLMIDAEGTLAQWFIGQNRRNKYEKELQRGRIYTLTNFYASNSRVMYHVADQRLVICISHASALSKDEEDIEGILTERFRDDSASQKVMVHLQHKDGPVINVYLWDEAAVSFRLKFDASEATPTVFLVTTVNPKSLGGKLCLSSMSSSRVFLDEDVDPTREYLTWPDKEIQDQGRPLQFHFTPTVLDRYQDSLTNSFTTKESATQHATYFFGAQNHRPGTEVEISDVAESSGGGTSATDDQKKAKRTKRSG
ncbi:hypothetical protein F2Q69_00030540 [Brassica cretica]|uniref:Uncharacterized protein n=1 Tax=Brassica cretica TaxID=69181 RepID=A0A8S9S9Q9_BRACR|nr:hypothetical protein F2Q69_00030540 [Brassica cretica]